MTDPSTPDRRPLDQRPLRDPGRDPGLEPPPDPALDPTWDPAQRANDPLLADRPAATGGRGGLIAAGIIAALLVIAVIAFSSGTVTDPGTTAVIPDRTEQTTTAPQTTPAPTAPTAPGVTPAQPSDAAPANQ